MSERSLPKLEVEQYNIPAERMLWFSGEHDGSNYAMYVSQSSPELVLVVQRGKQVTREAVSVQKVFDTWAHSMIRDMKTNESDTYQES